MKTAAIDRGDLHGWPPLTRFGSRRARIPHGPAAGADHPIKTVVAQRVRTVTAQPMITICQVLGMARRTAYYVARARTDRRHHRADDGTVLQQI